MATPLTVPKLGLTMTKGKVSSWSVADGAPVKRGDILYVLGTDKTETEIEADVEGVVAQAAATGVTVVPGEVVGWILAPGESRPEAPAAAAPVPVTALPARAGTGAVALPATVAAPSAAVAGARRFVSPNARRVAAELGVDLASVVGTGPNGRIVSEDVEAAALRGPVSAGAAEAAGSALASPLAAKLAAQLGVGLDTVAGSGANGRVLLDDVLAAARPTAAPAPPGGVAKAGPVAPAHRLGERIPMSMMRDAIADRMHSSLQQMAQLTLVREVNVDALVALRSRLKDDFGANGWAVPSITDLVVKATALSLLRHPMLNAALEGDTIAIAPVIDIGLAVSVDAGLVVPVVRGADELPLRALAEVTTALAGRARDGKLGPDDYAGPTFSVTALGASGIDAFTPVINPPNVAILGVGRIKDGVAWDGETPRRTQVMTLSLTIDHRVVDGAPGAAFLATFAELVARPLVLVGA